MKRVLTTTCVLGTAIAMLGAAHAQTSTTPPAGTAVPVTVDNFVRAESDMYVNALAKQ